MPIANNSTPLPGLLAIQRSLPALKLNRFCVVFLNQQHQPFYDLFSRRHTNPRVRDYVVWERRDDVDDHAGDDGFAWDVNAETMRAEASLSPPGTS